ncbi:enamine deaminase RidA (YjgF/YER057c/UK114 family) [Wenyingzhuangia heitensis]|uniref:Enamine deaminase RidA (YjgF/YER057c/UK114 family) n=2 Tax=Wenyingzhuangia heitensis TaxID=1487859 RepID=A0ABX0U9J0_9FLAO|nr:enamine deaminase RidA (YjgF/YER057c/UK114 family) [Wenyingzhuangia heitensis]
MNNKVRLLVIILLTTMSVIGQNLKEKQMEKRIINPWKWQNERSYVQAVEVIKPEGTLYVSGQTAIDSDGKSSTGDMKTQLVKSIENLEKVIKESGYECKNIVRLNIYTTSSEELFTCFDIFQNWITKHNIKQTSTLLEVKNLFETLKIELEVTVVK